MQIVLLSMDPVFLVPLFPPRTFFFPLKGGERLGGRGREVGKTSPSLPDLVLNQKGANCFS